MCSRITSQGLRHLGPHEPAIRSVTFTIDDGHALFYDFDALGVVLDAKPLIDAVANANRKVTGRKPLIGDHPRIHFHPGRSDLLAIRTALGRVRVDNLIDEAIGSPRRVALESRIGFQVSWNRRTDLKTALIAIDTMSRFWELVVGRPQNLRNLLLNVPSGKNPSLLKIYSPMANRWMRSLEERAPGPHDVLIDGVRSRAELGKVLRRWLALDNERRDARLSFANAFRKGNKFSEDRLIAAANMFDLLPPEAIPKKSSLNKELADAKGKARALFEALADSPERDSMLSAIGRLGTTSLSKKVLHRAKIVTDAVPKLAPDMAFVVREAIKCRNHYVHGSDASFDYRANGDAMSLFTNTLEFVFGASELIECGWSIGKSPVGTHPFSELVRSWTLRVQSLRANVKAKKVE